MLSFLAGFAATVTLLSVGSLFFFAFRFAWYDVAIHPDKSFSMLLVAVTSIFMTIALSAAARPRVNEIDWL